ncbi:hypothetical protein [Haloactinopolyspora alba]|uniref:hypothetical protein n=1 Tax=Haloactinopolyspora alba TaxID=648780 RepID=UPI0013ECB144|nr:hypothetical protein [Haloactinopolyspora alba]
MTQTWSNIGLRLSNAPYRRGGTAPFPVSINVVDWIMTNKLLCVTSKFKTGEECSARLV